MKEKRETTTAAGQQTAEKVGSSQQNERPFPGFTGFTEFRTRSFLNSSHSTVLFGAISFLFTSNESYWVFTEFDRVLLRSIRFYWVLLGFTALNTVLLGFHRR